MTMDRFKELQQVAEKPVGEAHCLPFFSYKDQEIYSAECTRIFHSGWVFACAALEIANPGDYFAFELGGEQIVVVRDNQGDITALSNICRHRGTPINDLGIGNKRRFVCPYHAWTYQLDGSLLGVPHPGGVEINKSQHCLPRFSTSVWHGLVFVSLSENVTPLNELLAGIDQYLKPYDIDRFENAQSGDQETWNANWKLAMENAMESYHLFKVHKDTLETTTPTAGAYYLEGGADWSVTGGEIKGLDAKLWNWLTSSDAQAYSRYILISIPPGFVGIVTVQSFDWIAIYPKSPTECWVRSAGLHPSSQSDSEADTAFVEAFFAEDKSICERVQRGMSASHVKGGRLVELERVVVDFHRYYATKMFGSLRPDRYKSNRY